MYPRWESLILGLLPSSWLIGCVTPSVIIQAWNARFAQFINGGRAVATQQDKNTKMHVHSLCYYCRYCDISLTSKDTQSTMTQTCGENRNLPKQKDLHQLLSKNSLLILRFQFFNYLKCL